MTDPDSSSDPTSEVRPAPPVIGLTGPVASGKSSVARLLAVEGACVIDVDLLGHVVLARPEVADAVATLLGDDVRGADGLLDHGRVAARVFDNPDRLRALEAIVHPLVRVDLDVALEHAFRSAPRAVVIDAALLFEGGLDSLCDTTICVDADPALRLERAERGRGWDAAEVKRRAARQLSPEEKRARAMRVLQNDGPLEALLGVTTALLEEIVPTTPSSGSTAAAGGARGADDGSTEDDR